MRLIDLHCNWFLQYATETTLHDPSIYPEVPDRVGRLDGYLSGAAASVLVCGRKAEDWARQGDPWRSLGELLARYEAEFSGRLLLGASDVARWRAEPADAMCWGLLAISGLDFLVREPGDLDRIPALFERGARVFQLVDGHESLLAGSAEPGDDRGLTELGRSFLARLESLAIDGGPSPRPIVDLAHLNPRSMAEVLDWLDGDVGRAKRLLPLYGRGALRHPLFDEPRALSDENAARLRALGGVIGLTPGPPSYPTLDAFKGGVEAIAAMPFEGRPGHEGIAIGADLLGIDQTLPGLEDVSRIATWIGRTFDPDTAAALIAGNGRRLLLRSAGVEETRVQIIP